MDEASRRALYKQLLTPNGLPKNRLGVLLFEKYLADIIEKEKLREATLIERTLNVASGILFFHFGSEWYDEYIYDGGKTDFLAKEVTKLKNLTMYRRITFLAEMILNLRSVPGIGSVLKQLTHGHVESGFAELRVGQHLAFNRIPFKFVTPKGKRGDNYDLEVKYPDGRIACSDTKCKLESGTYSVKSVENTLHDTRDQLPKSRPGRIFIQIPQDWLSAGSRVILEDERLSSELSDCADKFLRSTERIVAVNFFCDALHLENGVPVSYDSGFEVLSKKHRFDSSKKWSLYPNGIATNPPPGWRLIDRFF